MNDHRPVTMLSTDGLPPDFARRVIAAARALKTRRRRRHRFVATLALAAIVSLPLLARLYPRPDRQPLIAAASSAIDLASQEARFGTALGPTPVADYFVPAATSLNAFADATSPSAWYYDDDASDYPD